ncbi:protein mono-ADP-ribosyltransferase PARP14-like [Haliotis rufescens]|uniref:protein mono-ADP-ribosyltransferase PARP14-like n=1 Tax=Haliotis rufescens TaxID=6454 RepID=UPI00201EB162|nr:protein mono-ADP-ribosyltransferase PARP14-like [Haliotis rufescens]XP_048239351.1 protein mono-ADP-ribosyltransferase PARP14-like [Haliotis rufescens]
MSQVSQITLVSGELARNTADVIVSSTGNDGNLSNGSVSYSLLEAGGQAIQEEVTRCCSDGKLQTGSLVTTRGGNLRCKNIFHVVLSQWTCLNDESEELLLSLVSLCLENAAKRNFTSIAFPALGTGFNRFPGERTAEIIFTSIETYLQNNPTSCLKTVNIVIHPRDAVLQKDFEARRDGRSAAHANFISKEVNLMKTFTQQAGSSEPCAVKVVIGNLAKLQADVLVNTTQTDLILSIGAVSFSLLEEGGMAIQQECTEKKPTGLNIGGMVESTGGKLQCKKIFHVVLPVWNNGLNDSEKVLQSVVLHCLEEASRQNFVSIGFPVLGTGYVEYPAEKSAKLMLTALVSFLNANPDSTLQTVFIVVHPKDATLRKVLESQVSHGMEIMKAVSSVVIADGSQVELGPHTHVVSGQLVQEKDLFHESFHVAGEREALLGTQVMYRKFTSDNVKAMTPEDYHYRTVEAQFYKRMLYDPENKYEVTAVEYVVNPSLCTHFRKAQERMRETKAGYEVPVLAFHGTKDTNIRSICEEGFRQPDHPEFEENTDVGWYGNGIYFSEFPSYSSQYVEGEQMLLLCKVLQGRIFKCSAQKLGAGKEPGYDSHVDPHGLEIVIYDQDCILPCYIVHYIQIASNPVELSD